MSGSEYTTTIDGLRIRVDKVGGGTLGRAYEGAWSVTVEAGPVYVYDNDELITGTPATHAEVAAMAAGFSGCLNGGE